MFVTLVSSAAPVSESDATQMLQRLDHELEIGDTYIHARRSLIDSLKTTLSALRSNDDGKLDIMIQLGDCYNAYRIDSALYYYGGGLTAAKAIDADSAATRFALKMATYLPLQMLMTDAEHLMDSVSAAGIPPGLLTEYYDAQRQMNNYISNVFADFPDRQAAYRKKEFDTQRRLLDQLDKNSSQYKLNLAEHHMYSRNYPAAKKVLNELIGEIGETNPMYARACHMLADIAKVDDNYPGQVYYLALSAISDIRCATLEMASLQELGALLFKHNDVQRAHSYLSHALRNAVECQVTLRIIQTSKALPIIENAHKAQKNAFKKRIFIVIAIMGILLLALFVSLRMVYRNNLVQRRLAERLEKANKTKDVYIAQFLNLCSIYMDKLNQFNKLVSRKISAGKSDDLLKLTKTGKLVEEQSKEFYEVFDDAFLNIYPSFVEDVNTLLAPDKQLILREGEKLNTDLCILALMRLGIDDTSRIAQMLNYSVYTIYTYRNKFKSRAIDRDSFEADVMKIKSIS